MTPHRWPAAARPDELGAIAHGPVVLARAPGIVAALRCVFAHTDGILLPFVLRAHGVQGEAACRHFFRHHVEPSDEEIAGFAAPWSAPQVHVEVNDVAGFTDPGGGPSSGGDEDFEMQAHFWIDEIPRDGELGITVAWPQAGLPPSRTVLHLEGPDDRHRVLPLL